MFSSYLDAVLSAGVSVTKYVGMRGSLNFNFASMSSPVLKKTYVYIQRYRYRYIYTQNQMHMLHVSFASTCLSVATPMPIILASLRHSLTSRMQDCGVEGWRAWAVGV